MGRRTNTSLTNTPIGIGLAILAVIWLIVCGIFFGGKSTITIVLNEDYDFTTIDYQVTEGPADMVDIHLKEGNKLKIVYKDNHDLRADITLKDTGLNTQKYELYLHEVYNGDGNYTMESELNKL